MQVPLVRHETHDGAHSVPGTQTQPWPRSKAQRP